VTSLVARPRLTVRALPQGTALIALGLALALVLSAALAVGLGDGGPPLGLTLAAGLGALGVLALTLWRYDAAVALGFLVLGIVRIEPAPVDGVFAIVMAVAIVTGRFDFRSAPLWAFVLVGLFLALNLLACMEAVKPSRAASFMSITVYLCLLGLWISGYVRTEARARMVLRLWVGTAVLTAAASTLALYVAFPGAIELHKRYVDRAQGFFNDPNVYGPFLIPAAIFVLHELLEPRLLRGGRLLKLLCLSVLVLGVTTSYSRAAWLNLGVAVLVMLAVLPLRRGGVRRASALLVTLVACFGAAGAAVVVSGSSNFLEERAHLQSYDSQRFGAQRGGIELAEEHPLGVGPGQFELLEPISAHSTFVRALAEEGIVGLAVLAALLLTTLGVAIRNVMQGRSTAGLSSTALLAAWCGLLANSFFVDTLHWRHLWILAGLIWAGSMLAPAASAQASSSTGVRSPV
jgi:O-antigen ligase